MPSNSHKSLLLQLREITRRVRDALGANELKGLPEMVQAHHDIMLQFRKVGDCKEPELIDLLEETNAEVQAVINQISTRQTEVRNQMKTVANKKRLAGAYGV